MYLNGGCETGHSVSYKLQEVLEVSFVIVTIMGSLTLVLSTFAVLLVIGYSDADRQCPLPSRVYNRTPKCKENYECSNGKLCCLNQGNEKSCVEAVSHGGTGSDKYGSDTGSGVMCDGQRCSKYEICEFDRFTKRKKCVRK